MPKKKPSLGRGARSSGKSKQKRNHTTEVLAAEIAVLHQQLANNKAELELLHGRTVATLGGLTGTAPLPLPPGQRAPCTALARSRRCSRDKAESQYKRTRGKTLAFDVHSLRMVA
jgi:hypothetical protein